MDDLTQRFRGLDEINAPDVWSEATTRQPTAPSEPSLGRRLGVIVFAAMIGIGALGLTFTALRENGRTTGSDSATPGVNSATPATVGMVESGGSYRLSDLSMEFPTDRIGEAKVTYSYAWASETFPGQALCTFTLFDEKGRLLTEEVAAFTALQPQETGVSTRVSTPDGTPADAQARCGPGMVYEGPWRISAVSVEGTHLVGDLRLVGTDSTGVAACAWRWVDASGDEHIGTSTLSTGSGEDQLLARAPGDLHGGDTPEIRCESYRSAEQLDQSYWLPWVEETPVPTVSPSGSPAGAGLVDEQRVGVYEAMIRKLVDEHGQASPIVIRARLCSYLRGQGFGGCSGQIRPAEQELLATRLRDLGRVLFIDDLASNQGGAPSITLLGPIIETPDGLRVEGGYWCGGLCAEGAMYVVKQVDSGYRVAGKDLTYGSWIS
jgi:hypothetical protein